MNDRLDPRLTALERRLERASPAVAPAGLRRHVLSAIDDVLHDKATAGEAGRFGDIGSLIVSDAVACSLLATAIAAAVALVVLSSASVPNSGMPMTLDARVRIAGLSDDAIEALVADGGVTTPALARRTGRIPPRSDTLCVRDGHRLLQETL